MKKRRPVIQEILPWTNGELENLLKGLIAHGTETAKVDFKAEIETKSSEQKAELLKDISAIANTYDDAYNDHGFLIFGIKNKAIAGISVTEADTDKFQNTVEQLLKAYIGPMPQIYVIGFDTNGMKWGVIVIPPRNSKPHMFIKDLACTNPAKSRKRGEWFVRHGATTDPGMPEDLALITQKQTDLLLEPLRESVRSLQSRVGKTEEQYNSALFKLVERAVSGLAPTADQKSTEDLGEALGLDLPTRLKQKLRTPKDAIAEDLVSEAKALKTFLDGADTGLPWAPQPNNPAESKKLLDSLEEKIRTLQISVASIVLNDQKGAYTDALLRAVKILAVDVEIPSGTSYNRIGKALRYYPLGLILYTIFVCGAAVNRGSLLKQVLDVPFKVPRHKATTHITDIFFFWYDAKSLFNDALGAQQRRCEPIVERIRQSITDHISELIVTELSESEYFFRGEFALALVHLDICMTKGEGVEYRTPGPGLYLYMHEVDEAVSGLLSELPDWLPKLYAHPLNEILDMFDRNAHKMADQGCIALGVHGLNTRQLYDDAVRRRAQKVSQG